MGSLTLTRLTMTPKSAKAVSGSPIQVPKFVFPVLSNQTQNTQIKWTIAFVHLRALIQHIHQALATLTNTRGLNRNVESKRHFL